jgi:hypothetical protein
MNTIITGQCKIDFEKYLFETDNELINTGFDQLGFYTLPFSMQFGVIQDFFNKNNIVCIAHPCEWYDDSKFYFSADAYTRGNKNPFTEKRFNDIDEARTHAIQEANKIYNENLNTES